MSSHIAGSRGIYLRSDRFVLPPTKRYMSNSSSVKVSQFSAQGWVDVSITGTGSRRA